MIHLAGQATKTQFTVATQRAGREGNQSSLSDGAARVVGLAQLVWQWLDFEALRTYSAERLRWRGWSTTC